MVREGRGGGVGWGGGILQDRARAASRLICDITRRSWDEPEPERAEGWKILNPCDCPGSLLMASFIFDRETGNFILVTRGRRREQPVDGWVAPEAAFRVSIIICWIATLPSADR